ncbi:MAG: sigma-70 family RNA polymerase sigma factor [Phycisphaerae bacterium]
MPTFRIQDLSSLARQLAFAPRPARLRQLAAAEELLLTLDATRGYPLDYVVYRLTGYQRKGRGQAFAGELLTGEALQYDLGLLIEQVSDGLELRAEDEPEPVLLIEDVAGRLDVTSKTIQRWRRKGLPARRFVFPDGKKRVGFLLGSVERFLANQHDVGDAMPRGAITDEAEQRAVVCHGRRLVARGCTAEEASRRIARRLGRSPLSVLHTLRRHDQFSPADAVLVAAAGALCERDRDRLLRLHDEGLRLNEIAKRLARPVSTVHAAVVAEKIRRLDQVRLRFFDDELYHGPDAATAVAAMVRAEELPEPATPEAARIPAGLPPYLKDLYRTPLLTPGRERALFIWLNYEKYVLNELRRQLEPQLGSARDVKRLERQTRHVAMVRNRIVQANLRLVVSVARKHLRANLNLMELVSDGNMALLRAVDGFDPHRGVRFSTFATLALMKSYARSVPKMLYSRAGGMEPEQLQRLPALAPAAGRLDERDEVEVLLGCLNERERTVVRAHFGLHTPAETAAASSATGSDVMPAAAEAATLEEVGRRLGITKGRVRQIEQAAFAKLRQSLES